MLNLQNYFNNKTEKYFFYVVILLNLFPIISNQYWVTMDGSAHVYNATILKNILVGDAWYASFYEINKELLPNWFGHFVLVIFKMLFSGEIADKLFLTFYGILFPISFRYLIQQIAPKNIFISYLILPFMYTFVFTMGFYNYCFSLIFLFLIVGYYIKFHHSFTNNKRLVLAGLLLLCYFSHLFSFITSVLILWMYLLFLFFSQESSIKTRMKFFFQHGIILLLCSIIPITLSVLYFYNRRDLIKSEVFIPIYDLTKELYDFRALFSYTTIEEGPYNKIYFIIFSTLSMVILYSFSNKILLKEKPLKHYFISPTMVWILLCLLFIVMYYKMPDSDGQAGFISVRLAIMIYIFIILIFASSEINKIILFGAIIVLIFTNFMHLRFKNSIQKDLNKYPIELSIVEKVIPEHSVIYPIDLSGNWLAIHFSNYLAANKPVLVLDNYEASNNYFPIKWKQSPQFNWMIGNINLYNSSALESKEIDYVLVQGNIEALQNQKNDIVSSLFHNYTVNMVLSNFILFKKNTP